MKKKSLLYRHGWLLALQGLALAAAALLSLLREDGNLRQLIEFLALILLIFGALLGGISWIWRKQLSSYGLYLTAGFLQILLGLILLYDPDRSREIYALVIGGWAVLTGLLQLLALAWQRQWLFPLFLQGLLSIAFGGLMIWNPFETPVALHYLVAFYTLLLGLALLYYGLRPRFVRQIDPEASDIEDAPAKKEE